MELFIKPHPCSDKHGMLENCDHVVLLSADVSQPIYKNYNECLRLHGTDMRLKSQYLTAIHQMLIALALSLLGRHFLFKNLILTREPTKWLRPGLSRWST